MVTLMICNHCMAVRVRQEARPKSFSKSSDFLWGLQAEKRSIWYTRICKFYRNWGKCGSSPYRLHAKELVRLIGLGHLYKVDNFEHPISGFRYDKGKQKPQNSVSRESIISVTLRSGGIVGSNPILEFAEHRLYNMCRSLWGQGKPIGSTPRTKKSNWWRFVDELTDYGSVWRDCRASCFLTPTLREEV